MKVELTDAERQSKAAYIKGKIDRLADKWESLDASGLYNVEASYCQRKMRILEKELKALTGEDY